MTKIIYLRNEQVAIYSTCLLSTVKVTLEDDDAGCAIVSTTAVIMDVGVVDNKLQIVGTDDADSVSVDVKGGKSPKVIVYAIFLGPIAADFNKNSKLNTKEYDVAEITSVLMVSTSS